MKQWILPALALLTLAGCSSDPGTPGGPAATGTMGARLTDAPANLDAVNLTIVEVAAHRAADDSWVVVSNATSDVELLSLRNGVFAEMGEAVLPAGQYDELRLVLAEGATVVVDGVTHPLDTPSATTSGLKVQGVFDVPADGRVDVELDLDAGRSIRQQAGGWRLHPVLRGLRSTDAGSIGGTIVPPGEQIDAFAVQGADTIASATPEPDGRFVMSVLPEGDYDLHLQPRDGRPARVIRSLRVVRGSRTSLGDVDLRPLVTDRPPTIGGDE